MITKITATAPSKYNYLNNRQISFKGYNTTCDNIDIYNKKINAPISSMSGDIEINSSSINGNISNMSGYIDVLNSNIEGNIKNMSGKIRIKENSAINGDVNNISGEILLNKSSLSGNISSTNGKILVRNSVVDGTITAKPENICLDGENKIKELILSGFKKAADKDINAIKEKLAKKGIFIGSIGQVYFNTGTVINTFDNNNLVSTKIIPSSNPYEFKLPKGSVINTIKFDADKQGVLILEKGTEFLGKLINGIIKRL